MLASWGITLTRGRPLGAPQKEPGAIRLWIGDLRAPALDSHCRPAATWDARDAADHSRWENGQGPLRPRRPSKAPHAKMLGPTLPLASALTTARNTVARRTAGGSGLPPSWGLTLTLGRPMSSPSQGPWRHNAGDWGHRSPSAGLTCRPAATRATRGAAVHSGRENGQGPPTPQRLSTAPRAKTLGPTLRLSSALTLARPSVHRTVANRACWPRGG